MFVLIFSFFTYIVASKLPSYFFVVAPIGIMFIGIAIHEIIVSLFEKNRFLTIALVGFCVIKAFNPKEIFDSRNNDTTRQSRIHNTNIYKRLKKQLPPNCKIIINVNEFEHPDAMFYNEGITAYHWWLSESDIKELARQKIPIAAFENHGQYVLPDYIRDYKYLFIIKEQLK
jgi:hypothetical protein